MRHSVVELSLQKCCIKHVLFLFTDPLPISEVYFKSITLFKLKLLTVCVLNMLYSCLQGHYLYLEFTFKGSQLSGKLLEPAKPRHVTKSWIERVVVVGLNNQPNKITMVTKGKD